MKIEGRVGRITAQPGSLNPLRTDTSGGLLAKTYGGKHTEAALAGRLFSVSMQAADALTAALATNWEGLSVGNPERSGKLLIMHEFGWGLSVVSPDDGVIGLMTTTSAGFSATTAPRPAIVGSGAKSVAYCDDDVASLDPAPVLERICGTIGSGATTTELCTQPAVIDLEGSIILPPGYAVCTYHTTALTAALLVHFMWEEVDI